uniref:Uncharacterized protein n=1 Tax=Clastoptera arizonana TaxID=38151 RepID=A0A1B6C804_9HEMI
MRWMLYVYANKIQILKNQIAIVRRGKAEMLLPMKPMQTKIVLKRIIIKVKRVGLSTRQPAWRIPQLARRQHPSVRSEFTADGKPYLGNDGLTEWEMEGSRGRMRRTPAHNVVIRLPGPKDNACNARSPLETFSLYSPDRTCVKCK